jgi:hypothetical protein
MDAADWGVVVTLVELKDIHLPDTLKRAMAKQAEAEREKRARIVAAEGRGAGRRLAGHEPLRSSWTCTQPGAAPSTDVRPLRWDTWSASGFPKGGGDLRLVEDGGGSVQAALHRPATRS